MKVLESERLILREWQEDDAADLYEFSKSPNVMMAGAMVHQSISDSLECIKAYIQSQETWAIVLKEYNKPIGWIGLYDTNRHDKYKEVEFVLSDHYQNKGYATEAVKLLLKYAFCEFNLLVVAVCHYPDNVKSKRVIEKCGFTYEGTLRKYSKNLSDSIRYSMTKEEWEGIYCPNE